MLHPFRRDRSTALAGTFIAEIWPVDRRAKAGGYLQTGYYVGFFIASALNFTVGAVFGWRAMFLCGLAPMAVALAVRLMITGKLGAERN
jgi:MFS family permease